MSVHPATAVTPLFELPAPPCPVATWQEHHAAAKADAATGAPVTPHGRRLLETARAAPDGEVFGECLCGSSFLFTIQRSQP